eukprot:12423350-Karenia_brevis.AAC.1
MTSCYVLPVLNKKNLRLRHGHTDLTKLRDTVQESAKRLIVQKKISLEELDEMVAKFTNIEDGGEPEEDQQSKGSGKANDEDVFDGGKYSNPVPGQAEADSQVSDGDVAAAPKKPAAAAAGTVAVEKQRVVSLTPRSAMRKEMSELMSEFDPRMTQLLNDINDKTQRIADRFNVAKFLYCEGATNMDDVGPVMLAKGGYVLDDAAMSPEARTHW